MLSSVQRVGYVQRVDPVLKLVLVMLAIIAGAYASLSMKSIFTGVPEMAAFGVGTAFLAAGAFVARRVLRRTDESNPWRRGLVICRTLPVSYRCLGAAGVLGAFLFYDRFMDGDAKNYHLFTFVAPIMISTLLFDFKPGLFAVATSAFAVNLFLIPPVGRFGFGTVRDVFNFALFVFCATLLAIAIQRVVDWRVAARDEPRREPGKDAGKDIDFYQMFGVRRGGEPR